MTDSLLQNMRKTIEALKAEVDRSNEPEALIRIERLASFLSVQASVERAQYISMTPSR